MTRLEEVSLEYQMDIVKLALANAEATGAHPVVVQQIAEILRNERHRAAEYGLSYG